MACCCALINTNCCTGMPLTFHATFSMTSGSCTQYNGTWTLTYNSSTGHWENSNFGGVGDLLAFECASLLTPRCQGMSLVLTTTHTGCFSSSSGTFGIAGNGAWGSCTCNTSWTETTFWGSVTVGP